MRQLKRGVSDVIYVKKKCGFCVMLEINVNKKDDDEI